MLRGTIGILIAAAAAVAANLHASPASAQAPPFYEGKTITIIVGNSAGSGYDTYGRMITKFMARILPGNPA